MGGHHRSMSNQVHTDSVDRLAINGASTSEQSKSRRTLRQSTSMKVERKAYPLPDPKQFESPAATDAILYPLRSFKQLTEKERAAVVDKAVNKGEKEPAPKPDVGLKEPVPRSNSVVLSSLPEEVPSSAPVSIVSIIGGLPERKASKVVVVYDAQKKFTIAAVDAALREHATLEGDAILVVAFMEHIMSPMGMKMVADLRQFSGVNENIIKEQVYIKKILIENSLQNTNYTQHCETKKIQLGVKVIPGANPKALVAKEIIDFQATSAVFDKNAMRNKSYYVENLSCNISRLGKDGRKLETVSLFGQSGVMEKTGSTTTSHCSDSSSDSSMSSDSPSIWSRIRLFGSKRSNGGPLRQSFGSSSASSNLGSPRVVDAAEVLDESFSFDSPKPAPSEAYAYAAAGVARPTALAA